MVMAFNAIKARGKFNILFQLKFPVTIYLQSLRCHATLLLLLLQRFLKVIELGLLFCPSDLDVIEYARLGDRRFRTQEGCKLLKQ